MSLKILLKQPEVLSGTFVARCCGVVDLGTQSTELESKQKLYIEWELPNVRLKKGNGPRTVSAWYNQSMHEKSSLRKMLESWLGPLSVEEANGYDLTCLIGKVAMVTVGKVDWSEYPQVLAVVAPPEDTQCPPAETVGKLFECTEPWDDFSFAGLPDWLKRIVEKSEEYQEHIGKKYPAREAEETGGATVEDLKDDIPF